MVSEAAVTEGTLGVRVRSGCTGGVPFTDLNSSRERGKDGRANRGMTMAVRAWHTTLHSNSHKQGFLSDHLGAADRGSKQAE